MKIQVSQLNEVSPKTMMRAPSRLMLDVHIDEEDAEILLCELTDAYGLEILDTFLSINRNNRE